MLASLASQSAVCSTLLPFTVPAFYKLVARASVVGVRAETGSATPSTASHDVLATINDRPVTVPEGTSVLDAARMLNIHVRNTRVETESWHTSGFRCRHCAHTRASLHSVASPLGHVACAWWTREVGTCSQLALHHWLMA